MIEIEFEEPKREVCTCCGGVTTRLTRFVYKDGDAFAVYYGIFSDNHAAREVTVAVSLGEWGEGSSPEQRVAFPMIIRSTESEYEVSVTDANESPWKDVEIIGRMLNRNEALAHQWRDDAFHISDHIVTEDRPIIEYFEGKDSQVQ